MDTKVGQCIQVVQLLTAHMSQEYSRSGSYPLLDAGVLQVGDYVPCMHGMADCSRHTKCFGVGHVEAKMGK